MRISEHSEEPWVSVLPEHLFHYFGPLEDENYVTLATGQFAIFFQGEVHKPLSNYQVQESSEKSDH
ncbi:hypothetical protein [Vibrio jasicida]|uniref:hypothetical protein n=1 Tax=Vibrio jasicida TaxID=766224 RepID=UPI003908C0F4